MADDTAETVEPPRAAASSEAPGHGSGVAGVAPADAQTQPSAQRVLDKIVTKVFLWAIPTWVKPNHITVLRLLFIPAILLLLHYEHRIWSPYGLEGFDNGNAFYGTDGYMILSKRGGWKQFTRGGKLVKEEEGPCSIPEHLANFLAAIQSGRRPSADAETAHRSATLAHLANLLAKADRGSVRFDPAAERVLDDPTADEMVGRTYREGHWAVPKEV